MSMRVAVTGLNAAQTELSTIANNIANASTTGFKMARTEFADLAPSDSSGRTAGSGVRVTGIVQQMKQGGLEYTGGMLDLAINGNGFFVVKDGSATSYTRSGNFRLDTSGNVTTASGEKVQFYEPAVPVTAQTNVSAMKLPFTVAGQQQITSVAVQVDPTGGSDKSITVNGGTPLTVSAGTSTNAADRVAALVADINSKGIAGLAAFVDPADNTKISIAYSGPGTVVATAFSAAGSTDTSTAATGTPKISSLDANQPLVVNGTSYPLTRIDIDNQGVLRATYSNGEIRALGQAVVASFSTPTGLAQLGNTTWGATSVSGEAQLNAPGVGENGLIQSGALETSNVEITEQLVDMITAQRNFQANAKTISTMDQVAQAVLNIR